MTPEQAITHLKTRQVELDALSQHLSSLPESLANHIWIGLASCLEPQAITTTLIACLDHAPEVLSWQVDPKDWSAILSFLDHGPYITRTLAHSPWMLVDILASAHQFPDEPRLVDGEVLESRLREHISRLRGDTMAALRTFKRLESLRLFYYETSGRHSVSETTAGIADLAQACLNVCLDVAAHEQGHPDMTRALCLLGMGKLGGRELNYSSDVDIIAVCSDLVFADPEQRKVAEAIVRRVIALMDENTAQGYVFRVDLRLRPEGAQGLLVQCPDAMLEYYLTWGRTWERSALLKARTVAGHLEMGQQLLASLEPFVYKKYLDYQAIDELRAMKEMVNQNAQMSAIMGQSPQPEPAPQAPAARGSRLQLAHRATRRKAPGGLMNKLRQRSMSQQPKPTSTTPTEATPPSSDRAFGWDVKIGMGGIREIEFFVQALQLVHCGSRPGLRVKNTLDALNRLLYAGLLPHDDHNALAQAYDFYRRLEHRIQMEHDRQTHRLPNTQADWDRLAQRLGETGQSLEARVQSHRDQVSTIFGRLFNASAQTREEPTIQAAPTDQLKSILRASADALLQPHIYDKLTACGFERGRQVAGQLRMLKQKDYGPFGRRASTSSQKQAEFLLGTCATGPNPDRAFSFIARLTTTVGDREWFWSMLNENPHATQLLIHVFGSSDYLSAMLLKDPNIIQDLLGVGSATIERSHVQMRDALMQRLHDIVDLDHRRGRMQRFQQEEILRLSLHELGGGADIEQTTTQLSYLAEVITQTILEDIYEYLRGQSGAWDWPSFVDLPFCVVAMGKLGGQELGFGSDLDVFFVYDDREDIALDHVFYAKLAQRFVRMMSTAGLHGRLYEVDTRLRPSGQKGTLVVSYEALCEYYQQQASLWERQALIRARPLTGSLQLRRKLTQWRHEHSFERDLPEDVIAQVLSMRKTMRDHLDSTTQIDLKHSPGGLIDLEFLTQILQWFAYRESPTVPQSPVGELVEGVTSQHTAQALRALGEHPWVKARFPSLEVDVLVEDYLLLRRLEAILRVQDGRAQSTLPNGHQQRAELARRLRFHAEEGVEQFDAMIERMLERGHHAWNMVFEQS